MKKSLMIMMAIIASLTLTQVFAQKHRHTPQAQTTTAAAPATATKADAKPADGELVDSVNKGVTLYSDTTSAAQNTTTTTYTTTASADIDDFDDLETVSKILGGGSVVGIVLASLIFVLLVIFAPVIAIGLILYFMYKRNKRRDKIIQEAIDKGVEIPQELVSRPHSNDQALLQKGIRHVAIGIGLIVMFNVMGMDFFAAFGWFFAIYGVGQVAIAYSSGAKGNIKFRNPLYSDYQEKEETVETETTYRKDERTEKTETTVKETDNYDKSE